MVTLSDLRSSVNDTARVARANLLLFLVVVLFIGILVAGTDDLLLLEQARIELPLMQVGVPINTFYGVAPVLFVLLHLNLLVRLSRLSTVAGRLRDRIKAQEDQEQKSIQTTLVYPFDFLQLLLYRTAHGTDQPPPPMRRLIRYLQYERIKYGNLVPSLAIVIVPVFVFPLALLVWIQLEFLPYQDDTITLIHQLAVSFDIGLQIAFAAHIGVIKLAYSALRKGAWRARFGTLANILSVVLIYAASVLFVWGVAVVPGSWVERSQPFPGLSSAVTGYVFADWWTPASCNRREIRNPEHSGRLFNFRRYLYLPRKAIAAHDRPPELIAAYLERDEDPDEAWKFVEELDLSNRSLQYGWFKSAEFWRTNLASSNLRCARFQDGKLRDVILDRASMDGTEFRNADLRGASLERIVAKDARFDDANLRGANLRGATFRGGSLTRAKFHGVDGSNANFIDADLSRAEFHGADLARAEIFGARLSHTQFDGADMRRSEFHGADLGRAEFLGVNLRGARFRGSNLAAIKVYGTSLRHAEVTGSNMHRVAVYGADLRSLDITLSDLRGLKWGAPKDWRAVEQRIKKGLSERNVGATERNEELSDIRDFTQEKFQSRNLEKLTRSECVWTDRRGPFQGWHFPGARCLKAMEEYVLTAACRNDDAHAAEGTIDTHVSMVSWINVNTALALLETDPHDCPAVGETRRGEVCSDLQDWFQEPDPRVPANSVVRNRERKTISDRWSQAQTAKLCGAP